MGHGKGYLEAVRRVDRDRLYAPDEALQVARAAHYAKFDETVELHLRTGADPRHADQQVRGIALLPNGVGRQVKVLVFAQGEAETAARQAGADHVGADDLVKQIEGGWLDFTVAIATPEMMSKVGQLGRILGRRGLMPNPRSGTVVPAAALPKAVEDARMGRVEFRLDRTGLIHTVFGKISFSGEHLLENLAALVQAIAEAKPAGIKGQYLRTATLATSMGPAVRLDLAPLMALSDAA